MDARDTAPTIAEVRLHAERFPFESDKHDRGALWMAQRRDFGAVPIVYVGEIITVRDESRAEFSYTVPGVRHCHWQAGVHDYLWRALQQDGTPAPWPEPA